MAQYQSELMIKSASRVFFLKAGEIDWIEAADYYVRLRAGSQSHMLRETMAELEAKLDPQKFTRIHRSTIVNLDRIKQIEARPEAITQMILRRRHATEIEPQPPRPDRDDLAAVVVIFTRHDAGLIFAGRIRGRVSSRACELEACQFIRRSESKGKTTSLPLEFV